MNIRQSCRETTHYFSLCVSFSHNYVFNKPELSRNVLSQVVGCYSCVLPFLHFLHNRGHKQIQNTRTKQPPANALRRNAHLQTNQNKTKVHGDPTTMQPTKLLVTPTCVPIRCALINTRCGMIIAQSFKYECQVI